MQTNQRYTYFATLLKSGAQNIPLKRFINGAFITTSVAMTKTQPTTKSLIIESKWRFNSFCLNSAA